MAIADRKLEVGTKLVARYKKQDHHAEVVAGEEGKLRYRLEDGRDFKSPSAAGTAITGGACNGWAFWSVDGMAAPEAQDAPVGAQEPQAPAEAQAAPDEAPVAAPKKARAARVPVPKPQPKAKGKGRGVKGRITRA